MAHAHGVIDTDTHFKIDGITRAVQNRTETKVMVVQKDHNSERFTFELPRYIEAHDMSTCNLVQVHYLNIDAVNKKKYSGVYTVDDLRISEEDSELVLCSWLVSSNATQHVGSLNFVVRFACVENGVITYAWHTAVHTGVAVSESIDAAKMHESQYLDVIAQWKESVVKGFADDLVIEAKKASEARYSQLASDINVERKRIDNLVSGATADDAELIDIRVGADGVTYGSAGTAVREQIQRIAEDTKSICSIATPIVVRSYEQYNAYGSLGVRAIAGKTYVAVLSVPNTEIHMYIGNLVGGTWNERSVFPNYDHYTELIATKDGDLCFGSDKAYTGIVAVFDATNNEELKQHLKEFGYGGVGNTYGGKLHDVDKVVSSNVERIAALEKESHGNHLIGKTLTALGDSLTADASYLPFLPTNLNVINGGIGGTRISGTGENCFWQDVRINTLCGEIISIMGGTNDAPYAEIGTVSLDNTDTNTVIGALNVMLSKLYYRYGSAPYYGSVDYSGVEVAFNFSPYIVIMLPPNRFDSLTNYNKIVELRKFMAQWCELVGVECVDCGRLGITWFNEGDYFGADKVHYNDNARTLVAELLVEKLKQMVRH